MWRSILRRHSAEIRARGRALRKFARKTGLVYFGAVDQHKDEHDVIRGLTVSTTHRDTHYAVGTFDGYSVSIVDRFDIIIDPDGREHDHQWVILRIDLEREEPLPHFLIKPIGPHAHAYEHSFNAVHTLGPVNELLVGIHSPEFHNRFQLHMASTHTQRVEEVFTPEVTHVLATRLWPHAVELLDNKLYLYLTEEKLSLPLLDAALELSLWLARTVDAEGED